MKKTILTTLLASIAALSTIQVQAMEATSDSSRVNSLTPFTKMTLDSAPEEDQRAHAQNINEPLMAAAKEGNTQKVINLISQSADVNYVDENGWTALHLATNACMHWDGQEEEYRERQKTIKALVEAGADVNATINQCENADDNGRTALSFAAENGDIETVQLLIARCAHVNIADATNDAPLHWAARCGCPENIIRLLLSAGADLDLLNDCKQTALDLVRERAEEEEYGDIVRILLSAYADREADREVEQIMSYGLQQRAIALAQMNSPARPSQLIRTKLIT